MIEKNKKVTKASNTDGARTRKPGASTVTGGLKKTPPPIEQYSKAAKAKNTLSGGSATNSLTKSKSASGTSSSASLKKKSTTTGSTTKLPYNGSKPTLSKTPYTGGAPSTTKLRAKKKDY